MKGEEVVRAEVDEWLMRLGCFRRARKGREKAWTGLGSGVEAGQGKII